MGANGHRYTDFTLSMQRGDGLEIELAVTKTQAGITTAQDLSTGSVWLTAKKALGDADLAVVFKLSSSGSPGGISVIFPASAGAALATILPDHTSDLPARPAGEFTRLYVDAVYVDADGKQHTFQTGTLDVYTDVLISAA